MSALNLSIKRARQKAFLTRKNGSTLAPPRNAAARLTLFCSAAYTAGC